MGIEVLAADLGWPEGPAVLPDGSVAFVEMYRSQVTRWSRGSGVGRLADTGGGPNAVVAGADGALYLTQNGGHDGPWTAERPMPPSIQRIAPDGRVEVLADRADGLLLQAPNDLAFGPDGRLYFTDPGWYEPDRPTAPGRLFALAADGTGELLAELPPVYPNGIVVEPDGSVVWTESYPRTVRRRRPSGEIDTLHTFPDPAAVPDGLKRDAAGNLWVTATAAGGLWVLDPAGTPLEFRPAGAVPTNCAFGDGVLYVTDGGHTGTAVAATTGSLLAVPVEVAGAGLHPGWPAVAAAGGR